MFSFWVRKYFNRSVLALAILSLGLGWFVFIETRTSKTTSLQKEESFYVLAQESGNFGERYSTVLIRNALWRTTAENLEIGREYFGLISFFAYQPTSENYYEVYLRSLGIRGEAEISTDSLRINKNCDWRCQGIKGLRTNQSAAGRRVRDFVCRQAYPFLRSWYYTDVNCGDVAALITGLVYGDTKSLSSATKETIRTFGLSHLVAVSGFQVVLVASFLEAALARLRLDFRVRATLVFFALLCLGLYTGLEPPIVRSFLSASIVLGARLLGRRCPQSRALVYSAGVMLLINPFYFYSISFRLSCLATFALLQTRFKKKLWNYLFTPLFAFLYTLPVIADFGEGVSVVGIIANLLLTPVVPVITYLALLGYLPLVGDFFLGLVNVLILMLLNTLSDLQSLVILYPVGMFSKTELVAYYLGLVIFGVLVKAVLNKNNPESGVS